MKFATAVKAVVAVGLGFLSSQANFGVEAHCERFDDWLDDSCNWGVDSGGYSGTIQPSNGRRKLQDNAPLKGNVVMGTDGEDDLFVATNATNFPQGTPSGTLRLSGVYHRGLWQGPEIPA